MSKQTLGRAFGTCVITASLFLNGCAHQTGVQAMRSVDLEYFQIRCEIKQEQIKFLQSQRVSRDQQLFARVTTALMPWRAMTDPDDHAQRNRVGQGYTNWLIDQHLMTISKQCS